MYCQVISLSRNCTDVQNTFLELSRKIKIDLFSKSSEVVYKKFENVLDLNNLPMTLKLIYKFEWLLILASNDSLYSDAKELIYELFMSHLFTSEENLHMNILNNLVEIAGCKIQFHSLFQKTVCDKQVSLNQCDSIMLCPERAKELILDLWMIKALAEENYGIGTLFAYFR